MVLGGRICDRGVPKAPSEPIWFPNFAIFQPPGGATETATQYSLKKIDYFSFKNIELQFLLRPPGLEICKVGEPNWLRGCFWHTPVAVCAPRPVLTHPYYILGLQAISCVHVRGARVAYAIVIELCGKRVYMFEFALLVSLVALMPQTSVHVVVLARAS